MLGWLDYSLSAADRDTSNQQKGHGFSFFHRIQDFFGTSFSKKTATLQRIARSTPEVTPRHFLNQISNQKGNAQQQLRWAASSAAALLMSFVVTLQPAQVETVGLPCWVPGWLGWLFDC